MKELPAWLPGRYEGVTQLGKLFCSIQVHRNCEILEDDAPRLLSTPDPVQDSRRCLKNKLTVEVSVKPWYSNYMEN